jgi:hypothetical protein
MQIKELDAPTLRDFRGDVLTVNVQHPLPPGSRVAFSLVLSNVDETIPVQGKVVNTLPSKGDAALFQMTIRVHSLSRDARERLISRVGELRAPVG